MHFQLSQYHLLKYSFNKCCLMFFLCYTVLAPLSKINVYRYSPFSRLKTILFHGYICLSLFQYHTVLITVCCYCSVTNHVQLFEAPCAVARQALCPSLSPGVCSNSCPLSRWFYVPVSYSASSFLHMPSVFLSIRTFSSESALHVRRPEYWSFRFSISSSKEYSGLISLGVDWLNLLAVQGTPKSLLWHHNSKTSVLWCSTFFMVHGPTHICTWLLEKS